MCATVMLIRVQRIFSQLQDVPVNNQKTLLALFVAGGVATGPLVGSRSLENNFTASHAKIPRKILTLD